MHAGVSVAAFFFLNGLYFIRNQWFQVQCNSTPLTTVEPGNSSNFPETALQ